MKNSIYRRKRQLTLTLTEGDKTNIPHIGLATSRCPDINRFESFRHRTPVQLTKRSNNRSQRSKVQKCRTDISQYLQMIKSSGSNFNDQMKISVPQSYSKLNIRKRLRQMIHNDSYTQRKESKPQVNLSQGIKQIINRIFDTYEFTKQTQISEQRLCRLVKIAANSNKILCKIFLNSTRYDMKNIQMSKYEVVLNKKTVIARFQTFYHLFSKNSQQIQAILNLFYQKLDNCIHQMDNNLIKDVQKSVLKYNDMIQNMNYEMPIAINKQKYNSQKNILLQIKSNEKGLGECKNITRMSRQRYQFLDSIVNGIKNHPSW